ncbi:MAG: zf-HC2 domain-containing protein, partial [Thermoanaerobaculia bacterium]|nr:zf-HC2 domain-containing protein [Thermoanaerobaculia bacterium]
MTSTAAHLPIDMLSAFLDRELSAREAAVVEEHVESCPECRAQLDSLGRVVGRLRSLERMAPPQVLEMDIQRRIALATPEDGFLGKLDGRLGRLPVQPGILVTFALIFCFAAILFTFAQGLEDRHQRTIPIILTPATPAPSVESIRGATPSPGSRWEWGGQDWQLVPWSGEGAGEALE